METIESFVAEPTSLAPFVRALAWRAGQIELFPGEDASMVQLLLLRAARLIEAPIETSWHERGRVLRWTRE